MSKKPLESNFASKVDNFCKELPSSCWFNIQQASIRGTPDRLGVVSGRFVALELKRSEEAQHSRGAALQKYYISKLNAAGAYARIIYPENWAEIKNDLLSLTVSVKDN